MTSKFNMLASYQNQLFPVVYLICFIFIGLCYFDASALHSFTVIAILVSISLAIVVCELLKRFLDFCDNRGKRRKVLGRCMRDLLIGLGVMSICGGFFLWVPYNHSDKNWLIIYTTIVSTSTSLIFFNRFLRTTKDLLQLDGDMKLSCLYQRWVEITVACQFFLFIGSVCNLSRKTEEPISERLLIVLFHFLYILAFGFTILDFFAVAAGGVELNYEGKCKQESEDQERILRAQRDLEEATEVNRDVIQEVWRGLNPGDGEDSGENEEDVDEKLEKSEDSEGDESVISTPDCLDCEICCLPYSTEKLPLILKDCGHTVCPECIQKLIDPDTSTVRCPTCRTSTSLRENSPDSLPINHALLNVVNETGDYLHCEFCNLPYNDRHIPRVLRECGHTVCQNCVEDLLGKRTHHLFCTSCQKVTTVKEIKPEELPKNYALLKVIRETKM